LKINNFFYQKPKTIKMFKNCHKCHKSVPKFQNCHRCHKSFPKFAKCHRCHKSFPKPKSCLFKDLRFSNQNLPCHGCHRSVLYQFCKYGKTKKYILFSFFQRFRKMTKMFEKYGPLICQKKRLNRNQKINPGVSLPYLSEVYDIKIKIGFHHKSGYLCDTKSPKTSKNDRKWLYFRSRIGIYHTFGKIPALCGNVVQNDTCM
jgi:hypothetical protein